MSLILTQDLTSVPRFCHFSLTINPWCITRFSPLAANMRFYIFIHCLAILGLDFSGSLDQLVEKGQDGFCKD